MDATKSIVRYNCIAVAVDTAIVGVGVESTDHI